MHEHRFKPDEWPFDDPINVAAFTTVGVLDQDLPVLLVTHDDEDAAWQVLCGTTNRTGDCRVVCLGCLFDLDTSIGELHDLPYGWRAERASREAPWIRSPNPRDEDAGDLLTDSHPSADRPQPK
jgi:hypothetical protein